MNRNFGLQISPDLIFQLTQQHQQQENRPPRRPPLGKRPLKPSKPSPPPPRPPPVPPRHDPALDLLPPERPPVGWQHPTPYPPAFIPPLVPHETPNRDLHENGLEPIRKVLTESQKVVEELRKQEQAEKEEVTRRARELHETQYRVHEPRRIPCLDEQSSCIQCYKENPDNPLKCAESVRAYVECSRQVQQKFVAGGFQ